MKKIAVLLLALLPVSAAAQTLTVEVLSAEETHWTTMWNDPGSAGTTSTNCSSTDTNTTCTSTTEGARAASSTPIRHTRVDILVKMPDGNEVRMQCHVPPIWATCFKPALGMYEAKIAKHEVRLRYETGGKPSDSAK
jgi:hypothetical protein